MTDLTENLSRGWQTIRDESGQAIEWVGRVRGNARSVDNEADSLITKLRRIRNQAKSLTVASRLPSTVGFFGLSQAGKSYLISALAAGADGKLETEVDGKRLDFLIQELHREANTLGSKSAALDLTRISVDMKVLIEQMREQVQNIE